MLATNMTMNLLPPYEVYVDESNTPVFEPKSMANTPYVVCAIAIPVAEKKQIEALLPFDTQGLPIKASSPNMTDDRAAEFIRDLFRFDVLVSLVGLDSSDEENCQIATALTETANRNRSRKIRRPNLMYVRVAAQAIINVWGSEKFGFFDVIFDSNSLPKHEFALFHRILMTQFGNRGATIREISRRTEQQAPLLLAADIIAGVGKRHSSHQSVPKSWAGIISGQSSGKVFIENGIEVYNAG